MLSIPNIDELTAGYKQLKAIDFARLDEIEKALAAMGPYAMVSNYVTAGEVINVVRELKRIRHPERT